MALWDDGYVSGTWWNQRRRQYSRNGKKSYVWAGNTQYLSGMIDIILKLLQERIVIGAKWSDWRHFDILNFREVNVFIGLRNVKETKTGLLLCFVSQLDLIRKIRLRFKKCFGEDRFNKSIIQTKPWIKLRLKKWMFFEMFQLSPSNCEGTKILIFGKYFG